MPLAVCQASQRCVLSLSSLIKLKKNLKSEPCFSEVQSQPLCARVRAGWGPRGVRVCQARLRLCGQSALQAVPGKSGCVRCARRGCGCRCAGGKRWAVPADGSDGACTEPGAEPANPCPRPEGKARGTKCAKWRPEAARARRARPSAAPRDDATVGAGATSEPGRRAGARGSRADPSCRVV